MMKQKADLDSEKQIYLTCEKYYIFELLIFAAGMMGAYTFNLRGGVFCNAQTANVVLMALAFGKGEIANGVYYLIPISAYIAGAAISEILPRRVRKIHFLRWDTYLVGFEMLILFLIGFLPLSVPVRIVQVLINFICSMQYNTFRQAEGIPMATTFVTNHIRQIGIWLAKATDNKDVKAFGRVWKHLRMVGAFFSGGLILTMCCHLLEEKAIWLALAPLAISFFIMMHADRSFENSRLAIKPHGH